MTQVRPETVYVEVGEAVGVTAVDGESDPFDQRSLGAVHICRHVTMVAGGAIGFRVVYVPFPVIVRGVGRWQSRLPR